MKKESDMKEVRKEFKCASLKVWTFMKGTLRIQGVEKAPFVAMPLLLVRPGAPSSVLAPSSS